MHSRTTRIILFLAMLFLAACGGNAPAATTD